MAQSVIYLLTKPEDLSFDSQDPHKNQSVPGWWWHTSIIPAKKLRMGMSTIILVLRCGDRRIRGLRPSSASQRDSMGA